MTDEIREGLYRLAASRQHVEEQKSAIAILEDELSKTELYQKIQIIKEQLAISVDTVKQYDSNIRTVALDRYDVDPDKNKSINELVSIAEYTTFEIDEVVAIQWASEHHQGALKLDKAAIKKVAKVMPVDGIVLGKENRVKIASDLSIYAAVL